MASPTHQSSIAPATPWVAALCFVTAMVEGFDIQAMGVAAPGMIPALHLTPAEAGWAFGASPLGLMLGAAIGGVCADRQGRRPVLVVSTLMFGLMTLLTVLCGDYGWLLAVRFAAGLGLGGAMPMVVAIAAERTDPRRRIGGVAAAAAGMPLGAVCAGIVARVALAPGGWQSVFVIGGGAAIGLAALQFRALPETGRPVGAGPAPALTTEPGSAMRLALVSMTILLMAVMLHLLLNWLPVLLMGAGASRAAGMDALILFNLGGMAGSIVLGRWIDRAGIAPAIPVACVTLAVGLVGFAMARGVVAIGGLSVLVGSCVVGSQFSLYGAASSFFPVATRGRGVGIAVAAGRLGSAIGPLVAGELLQFGLPPASVFEWLGAVAVVTAGLAIVLDRAARGRDGEAVPA